ncbi:MAG: hypothetical protein AB8G05_15800 [Oligoflexales bacterium]
MKVKLLTIIVLILMTFNTQCGRAEKEKMSTAQFEFSNLTEANTITYEAISTSNPRVKIKKIVLKKSTESKNWKFHEMSEYSLKDESVIDYISTNQEHSISINQKQMHILIFAIAKIPKKEHFSLSCDLAGWDVLIVGSQSSDNSCWPQPERLAAIEILFDLAEKYKHQILSSQPNLNHRWDLR